MPWYYYALCFFGGAFAANAVPHFVAGISGRSFPTPFNTLVGEPAPPVGLSPAPLNVAWALVNLAIGYGLLRYGGFSTANGPLLLTAFIGFAAMSFMLANAFTKVPR